MKRALPYPAIFLIVAELFLIVSSTWWPEDRRGPFLLTVLYASLFCLGGYLVSHHKRWLRTYLPLTLITLGVELLPETPLTILVREVSLSLVFVLLFLAIIHHSWLWPDTSHTDRLLAGIGGYLLLGIFWAVQFDILISLENSPLQNAVTKAPPVPQEVLYYSFVTLTAVGYGEITPVTPAGRTVAMIASLSGTLYLAVFISSLIGSRRLS